MLGTFTIIRAVAPKMGRGRGDHVDVGHECVACAAGSVGTDGGALQREIVGAYSCSRFRPLSRGSGGARLEWGDSQRLERTFGAERAVRVETITQQVLPGKRIGAPDEVARAVLLLMTNAYMNGEVLHIDGAGRYV